ncbi:DotI/IcmL family type IV secretion protein [Pseudomonas syringae pv. syringae]|uniref:DotI/IcmL/TraM family protein n=1 Tax=Pseudomonas syringae TaxID=317 RepID=UPI00200AD179|nr:DotI/IcmL/TraM family protein [Pseudomonas syringae]MCK9759923.1 DotI/IcmL family type IV secretion protein [Pseudomonas syringae pv. syringae]MCK9774914.1 DotI/IcmL family type IV secretion protein [Pseudomonas syringae pv. syringae]
MQTENEESKALDDAAMAAIFHAQERAFGEAVRAQEERSLGADFARRCLTVLLVGAAGYVVLLVIIGFLSWKVAYPDVLFFATEKGRVVPMKPTNLPMFSDSDVSAFGADTIRESFTLDFRHYRDQTTKLTERYSDEGYQNYYQALISSNVLSAVKDQRMNLSVDVGPGVIRNKGLVGETFAWEYQYPVTLKLDGQITGSPPQRFIFTQRIQRTDVQVKNAGLEVTQIITSNAP